jgi:hypothetical protein
MSRSSNFMKNHNRDSDPLAGMANLFDLGMVFAVALMVALVSRLQVAELLTEDQATIVKNPGKENMEIIVKDGKKITKYKAESQTQNTGNGKGRQVGIAYEMENGEIIYIPESP